MIVTLLLTIFLGLIAIIDKVLGAVVPLQKATVAFNAMLLYIDQSVFYIRSILPLTLSNIFASLFLLFSVFLFLKIVSIIKNLIPFLNRFGSNGSSLASYGRGRWVGIRGSSSFPREFIRGNSKRI